MLQSSFFFFLECLDTMITEFVVMGNHSFRSAEIEKFVTLINKGFPKLSRKIIMNRITSSASVIKDLLKKKL